MSRLGLLLAGIYISLIVFCLTLAYSAGSDYKGHYVLMQLPIALQISLLHELGLSDTLRNSSWLSAYFLLAVPTCVVLYGIGFLMEAMSKLRKR